jgi:HAD superfamily hydrolase (TIGR01509 family)
MSHPRWDLVIFDNDGVLVDSEVLANQVLADLLSDCGYPATRDECVRRFMGGTIVGIRKIVEAEAAMVLPTDFEDRYHQGVFAAFRTSLQPVSGVVAVLDELARRRVPFCVASSGTHERIRLALSTVGLLDRFPEGRIFSAEDVAHGKPAPDLFLLAASRLGADARRCLVVEDSPAGVTAARAAGMTVVGYAAMTPAERLAGAGAAVVVASMAVLPSVLDQPRRGPHGRGVRGPGRIDGAE